MIKCKAKSRRKRRERRKEVERQDKKENNGIEKVKKETGRRKMNKKWEMGEE